MFPIGHKVRTRIFGIRLRSPGLSARRHRSGETVIPGEPRLPRNARNFRKNVSGNRGVKRRDAPRRNDRSDRSAIAGAIRYRFDLGRIAWRHSASKRSNSSRPTSPFPNAARLVRTTRSPCSASNFERGKPVQRIFDSRSKNRSCSKSPDFRRRSVRNSRPAYQSATRTEAESQNFHAETKASAKSRCAVHEYPTT